MNIGLLAILIMFIAVPMIIYAIIMKKNNTEKGVINDSENQLVHSVFDRWKEQVISHHEDLLNCALFDNYNCDILNSEYAHYDATAVFYFYTKMLYDALHHIKLIFNDFNEQDLPSEWACLISRNRNDLLRERNRLIKHKKYGQVDASEWRTEKHTFIDELINIDDYVTTLTHKIIITEQGAHDKMLISDYKQPDHDDNFNKFFDTILAKRTRDLYKASWLQSLDFSALVRDVVEINIQTIVSLLIDTILDDKSIKTENLSGNQDISSTSPYDYEEMCANILNETGWAAETTKKSGDQGVDVYAEKDGLSVILQCKLTNTPVGNKAVQEAISGQKYMSSDFSAVVTPAKYTPGAQDIARAARVLLLHHEDLPHLETLCKRLLS